MLALAGTDLVNIDDRLGGGGSEIAVLFASAFQILWLAAVTSRRLARLRVERDVARAAELRLAELARRDPLTGLLNRRGFMERLEQFAEHRRSAGGFGLLLIDVDHFKSINDTFGHEVGDAVLIGLAERLRHWEGDITSPARLGGEEFAIGVTGLVGANLLTFADHVRETLGKCPNPSLGANRRVTVSIGVAWDPASISFHALYSSADQALYEAKRRGRDCVVAQPRMPLVLASDNRSGEANKRTSELA